MGDKPSKPEELGAGTIPVVAPKTMSAGEIFDVEFNGAFWKGLEVGEGGANKGQEIIAICDPEKVQVQIQVQETAMEGEEFRAGILPFEYLIDKAPKGGVKTGDILTFGKNDINKKMYVFKNKENQIRSPSKEFTGVERYITEICSNLSKQIYLASSKKHFKLRASTGEMANIVIFDNHGVFHATTPSFAVAVINKTMICGWRGSNFSSGGVPNAFFDFITDGAIGPTICNELGKASSGIRMQNAMMSFAALELSVHGDEIVSLIQKHDINEIVFTGHSLGGGIAYCAHTILQAQMDGLNDSSSATKWKNLNGNITVRTVVFSAPMTLFGCGTVVDPNNNVIVNKDSEDLLEKVGKTTVNLIFGSDVVPRAYSHIEYFGEILDAVGSDDVPSKINKGTPIFIGSVINNLIDVDEIVRNIKNIGKKYAVPAIRKFRHTGFLLYYKDFESLSGDPLVLKDTGPIEGKPTNEMELNHYSYKSHTLKKGNSNIDAILLAHGVTRNSFASHLSQGFGDAWDQERQFHEK